MLHRASTFRRYVAHANIRRGSVVRGPQTSVGWSEPAVFNNLGRHIFGTFKVKANIIMQRHEVLYWLSSDSKMIDLE